MKLNRKKIIAQEFLILISCFGIAILAFIGTIPYNYFIDSQIENIYNDIKPLNLKIDSIESAYEIKIEKRKWFFNEHSQIIDIQKKNYYERKKTSKNGKKIPSPYEYSTIEELSAFNIKVIYDLRISSFLPTYRDLWKRLSELQTKESLIYTWENKLKSDYKKFLIDIGFKNAREFNQFISDYTLNEIELKDKSRQAEIMIEVNLLQSKIQNKKYKLLYHEGQIQFALTCLIIIAIIIFPVRYLIYSIRWSIKTLRQK